MRLTIALLFFTFSLAAQDMPTPIVGHPFARPGTTHSSPGKGLSIEYDRHPNYGLQTDFLEAEQKSKNEVEAKERFEAKVKFPLILKENFKVLGDLFHSFERYHFDRIAPEDNYFFQTIDGEKLKRSRLTFYALNSLNPKNYLAIRAEASFNGNYDGMINFDKRYAVYRIAGVFGIKQKEDNEEIALGVVFNNSFEKNSIYPFLIYNRTFNSNWGIETVVPVKFALRRNLDVKNMILLNLEYWSSAYAVAVQAPGAALAGNYYFKSSALQLFADWQNNLLSEWTWLSLKIGFSYNFDSKFVGINEVRQVDAFPSNSVFVSIGFFLSPPRRYLKR